MVVYNDMIDAREKAYAERIPRVDALLASDAVGHAWLRGARPSRAASTRS